MDKQVRTLIHSATCYTDKERIDLALQQLHTLGLINGETAAGRGRSATLWAKVQNPETGTDTRKLTHMAHRALKAHIPPIRRIGRLRRTFHPYGKLSLG